jgi:hypothetical protein
MPEHKALSGNDAKLPAEPESNRHRPASETPEAPLIDDHKSIQERERESELAGTFGSKLPGVIEFDGEERLANDPDPALNSERDAGVIVRLQRQRNISMDDTLTPIPPPPRRDELQRPDRLQGRRTH